MRFLILLSSALFGILALTASEARADLNFKQARKLISRMAGFELPVNGVRVKRILTTSGSSAEATAEIQTTLRFSISLRGQWRVAAVRTGPSQWEELDLFAAAAQTELLASGCDDLDPLSPASSAANLTMKRSRCLIAEIAGVQLPSDAVRVKAISPLALPLASRPSAVVEAVIAVDLRFDRDSGAGWEVTALRTGRREWVNLEGLMAAANKEKMRRARAELDAIARALETFRTERGFYVASERQAVLIDHLSPRFISRVIRTDPWHKPYQYQGEPDHFTLRSMGPDGKENTTDDIVVISPGR